ncbi:MAG: DM13 domain-containing protein [Geitlerinemataceae cyanobacterium]
MKKQRPLSISIALLTFLMLGCAAEVSHTEPTETEPTVTSEAIAQQQKSTVAPTPENLGNPFVVVPDSGHTQISGKAKTIVEGDKLYLVFDEMFQTDSGPDLTVVLVRSSELTSPELDEGSYLFLDNLQANSGEQRYEIPNDVNLEEFGSVAIWCRQFNTTFGYASLSATPNL